MKKIIFPLFLSIPIFMLVFCTASTTSKQNKTLHDTSPELKTGFAVIELFTSQGCSSCPAADRLLGKYADKENVYALSFHVDYWNRLGWTDPFSDASFTQRQYMYADQLNASVYTPQAVVNGQTEMVGSNENKLLSTLKKSLSTPSSIQINVKNVKAGGTQVAFDYDLQGNIDKAVLNVALVQNRIITSIRAGENRGVNLTNYNVVRNFKSVDLEEKNGNSVSLEFPPGFKKEEYKIIAFVQLKKTNRIVGATKFSL